MILSQFDLPYFQQSSSSKHASLAPKSSVERRQKNALFTNVFEQIRNVGKAPAKSMVGKWEICIYKI
jgi:hypothetical protein